MRTYFKKIYRVIFLTVSILILSSGAVSCAAEKQRTLNAISVSYPELTTLTETDLDTEYFVRLYQEHPEIYSTSNYFVYSKNGELVISDTPTVDQPSATHMKNGYFSGIDTKSEYGQHYGYCRYNDYSDTTGQIISNDCYYTFIKKTERHGYMISVAYEPDQKTTVTEFKLNSEKVWESKIIYELNGIAQGHYYYDENNTIYLATTHELVKLTPDNGNHVVLIDEEFGKYNHPNSIAQLNDCLYMGSALGIYEYSMISGKLSWFPIEH